MPFVKYQVRYMDLGQSLVRRFDTPEQAQEFIDVNALVFALRNAQGERSYVETATWEGGKLTVTRYEG